MAADSSAFDTGAVGSDVTGDGINDPTDRQILYANYGFVHNTGPQAQQPLPEVLTHVDLEVNVDLREVAQDPDGDPVFYRIVSAANGSAVLAADGHSMRFVPDLGFAGTAIFEIIADDGFNASSVTQIEVTVSDAPLTELRFVGPRKLALEQGQRVDIDVFGDFIDQQNVAAAAQLRGRPGAGSVRCFSGR